MSFLNSSDISIIISSLILSPLYIINKNYINM
nr:MAG TPA: hypothetical protein [Caudoviricetes sp.]